MIIRGGIISNRHDNVFENPISAGKIDHFLSSLFPGCKSLLVEWMPAPTQTRRKESKKFSTTDSPRKNLGEFANSWKGVNLNSHSHTSLPSYWDMYTKFEGYVNAGQAAPLSYAALSDI